jgi:hypothetical protein
VVSATAPQPGDVAVDVTRLTFCEPSASYLLTHQQAQMSARWR